MGSSDSKADNLQEQQFSPLTPTLLQQAQKTSPRLHKIAQNIIQHCKSEVCNQIESQVKNIHYDLPKAPLPLCLKYIDDYYQCQTCYGAGIILCHSCFEPSQHEGHSYALIDSKGKNICSCGNKELTDKPFSCKNHVFVAPMESQETMILFKTEMKFLFDLVLILRDRPLDPKISKEKLASIARLLLEHSSNLIKNNHVGAKLMYQILMEYPNTMEGQIKKNQKTIFEEIVYYSQDAVLLPHLNTIVSNIVRSDANKAGLLHLYYTFLIRGDPQSQEVVNMFIKQPINPIVFPISYQRHFDSHTAPLQIASIDSNDLDLVISKYNSLLKELTQLSSHTNRQNIFMRIFQQTSICQMLNYELYYLNNNEAKEQILELGNKYTLFVSKVIRIMKQHQKGHFLFQKMIIECFGQINSRKSQTFNRSYERIFARLVFEIYQHKLPTKQQLIDLLGIHSHETAINIILHFVQFRTLFHEEYRTLIFEKNSKNGEAILELVAMDQFFIKIMSNIIEPNEIEKMYSIYIEQKFKANLGIVQPNMDNVLNYLKKVAQFIQILQVSLPSPIDELILDSNSQKQGKEGYIILSNLAWILDNTDAIGFKATAEKFIQNEEVIIDFIKSQTAVENKKIKFKEQELQFPIHFSPDSDYLGQQLQPEVYEKIVNRKQKPRRNQQFDIFFHQKILHEFIRIWEQCSQIILQPQMDKKKCQKEVAHTLETLCNLYLLTEAPVIMNLIEKYNQKLVSPSPKLQVFLKTLLSQTVDEKQKKMELLRDKKKRKNDQLKAKQKAVLNTHKVQENIKIDLECIFCKNSEEGEPYLLGHFKYNNFYSKKILQMDVPFMEFTTCGHSAHEKCLRQMHKGQFRIWYPCIFCKSITNILLPWATSELSNDRRFEKILEFLKNFAATYTFFFQEQKELVEFGPNDVSGVYRMLIKTLVYSLTIYPIVNREYFQQKQFPILKFIYDLLVFTQKRLKNLSFSDNYHFKAKNELTDVFYYHHYQLEFYIMNNYSNIALQKKIDQYRDKFSEQMTELYDEIYQNLSGNKQVFTFQLKDTSLEDLVKRHIYKPPQDLSDLRQLKMKCKACATESEKFQVCLLCEWSCCHSCLDVRKVHAVEEHLGESVFLNGYTGSYSYLHEGLTGQFSSIYVDYLGNEANNKKTIKSGQFTINDSKWAKVVNDIVCDRLHKEVYRLKG